MSRPPAPPPPPAPMRIRPAPWAPWYRLLDAATGALRAAVAGRGRETIVAAAIRIPVPEAFHQELWMGQRVYPDKLIVTAPPPARHHTLLHPMHGYLASVPFEDQGFLTSKGRYVEREEGLAIAKRSGQPMIDHPSRHSRWLFSEDLW